MPPLVRSGRRRIGASANDKAPPCCLCQQRRGMQGVQIGSPASRNVAEGGVKRPNNQPAGIGNNNTHIAVEI